MLKSEKWQGEIILFTEDNCEVIPADFKLLGYDICADSKYYSPLGDGFLMFYNCDAQFFGGMCIEQYRNYKEGLNAEGLFESYSLSCEFAKYCNMINKKFPYVIESEEDWRPFAIYAWIGKSI